jgi:REP element-mobilizing transposase RayT
MPRTTRMLSKDQKSVYHVISRTALDGFPFGPVEKDRFVAILKRFARIYFTEMLGYAVMDNHVHILVRMLPDRNFSDEEIERRYKLYYGDDAVFPLGRIDHFRKKWASLSEFVREVKQTFSRYYNKVKGRKGTLWGERFKSVIVERGETLIHCLAYIDLNAVRAGIVKRPEDYRWCSLGYHSQTGNRDQFLSTDFGLVEFGDMEEAERFRRYRRYVYEAGALTRSDGKKRNVIDQAIVEKEREQNYEPTRTARFMNRTRYFTDSGIIGSRAFVADHYQQFKHIFQSRHEKKPKPIKGLDGIYSLRRLTS